MREAQNLETQSMRTESKAPAYLRDEEKLQDELLKDYNLANPEDAKAELRLAKLRELEKQ